MRHGLGDGRVPEDPRLERFSIERDREYVLPVLQLAQRLNPELRWVASPGTPPPWMKTNGRYGGGSLRPECQFENALPARTVATYMWQSGGPAGK